MITQEELDNDQAYFCSSIINNLPDDVRLKYFPSNVELPLKNFRIIFLDDPEWNIKQLNGTYLRDKSENREESNK